VDHASPGGSLGAVAHRTLLAAAVSPRVGLRRFVPAEYANDVARFPSPPSAERDKLYFRDYLRAFCPARGIEYTLVCNGILTDHFRPRGQRNGFLDDDNDAGAVSLVPVDAEARRVLVPGHAGDAVSFTAARDVARCVARLLSVEAGGWEEYTYISGDRLTWEEVARGLEAALGGAPVARDRGGAGTRRRSWRPSSTRRLATAARSCRRTASTLTA
jgi:nucleoside-diphosphate-sugar epimerase